MLCSLRTFSPYHNVRPDVHYPRTLFTTSTRDDRVHPGHARKMVARMQDQKHDVLYYENIEGGHREAADNRRHSCQPWRIHFCGSKGRHGLARLLDHSARRHGLPHAVGGYRPSDSTHVVGHPP